MDRQLVDRRWRAGSTLERGVWCYSTCAAAIAALAVLVSGCVHGSGDLNSRYVRSDEPAGPRHFMVLPINLTIKTSPEFEAVLDDMFGAIAGYIRDGGDSIETLSREGATEQWMASILEVKKSDALEDNFRSAMRVFVAKLAASRSFTSVIVPSIVYRGTKVRDRTVKWDGVFRKLKIVNLSDEARKKGLARSVSVDISGVSLHVMVFDPSGELIFQKYGGLDLAQDVDMTNAEFTLNPKLSLKQELLKNGDYLNEGIGEAFDHYLPKR